MDEKNGAAPCSVADPFTSKLAWDHPRFNGVGSLIGSLVVCLARNRRRPR